jgi:hypothetical protein
MPVLSISSIPVRSKEGVMGMRRNSVDWGALILEKVVVLGKISASLIYITSNNFQATKKRYNMN